MYHEASGKIAAAFVFIGFNLTFLPQFIMGSQGMPRRYYNYIDQFTGLHQTSTIGAYIMGIGFFIIAGYLAKSLINGKRAGANPWGSRATEWQTTSPPPLHNFDHTPVIINGPYDYHRPMEEFQLGFAYTNGEGDEHEGATVDVSSLPEEKWKNYSLG